MSNDSCKILRLMNSSNEELLIAEAGLLWQLGPRRLTAPEEVVALNSPQTWSVRAVGGPVTATARGAIEPLEARERSHLTISLEFEGHGIGRLLVPLVIRRQAHKQLPKNLEIAAAGTVPEIIGDETAIEVETASWERAFTVLADAGAAVTLAGRSVRVAQASEPEVRRVVDAAGLSARIIEVPATLDETMTILNRAS